MTKYKNLKIGLYTVYYKELHITKSYVDDSDNDKCFIKHKCIQ